MARINVDMWRRHSHPLSGWSRSLTQPLLCLPLWNRSWSQGLAIAVWLAVNPIIFPPPRHNRAWMTRAILGERVWVNGLKRQIRAGSIPVDDAALWFSVIQTVLLDISLYAAWRKRAAVMALSNVGAVAFNLWYLDRMARLYDEHQGGSR